jgi:serine protease AprX
MPKRRIIAHFMHERERDTAKQMMSHVQATESYVFGEIDEERIPDLQRQGLIVQTLEDQPAIETPGSESEPLPGIRRSKPRPSSLRGVPSGPSAVAEERAIIEPNKPEYYLVQLVGPLLEEWRQELEQHGVKLLEYMPRFAYTAKMTLQQANELKELPFIRTVRLYGMEDTGPIGLRAAFAPPPPPSLGPPSAAERKMLAYDLRVHAEEDLPKVLQWLQQHGINVAGSKARKIRLYLLEDSPLVNEISALAEVAQLEEYVPPKLHNNVARTLLGIDRALDSHSTVVEEDIVQSGDGQIVAVADTGIDSDHPDFKGRIVGIVALGRVGDSSDTHGHGTHVAGSVLGDGTSSGGAIRGVAPKAKLFFQSLMDGEGGLGGLPLNLGDLFEQAYQAGARIHNNSWGAATSSAYTVNSTEVDEFAARRRDMLIVISAGNEGQAENPRNAQKGHVDWLSIGSPASCKNALTIGACRSSRSDGPLSGSTYGEAFSGFPDPPIARENVSGNPESIAAFSSRGPCDDGRIKPEVVVPGTDIASAKSSHAPLRNFWGPFAGNTRYAFMGGTSMSAPLAAGCAALVREYYIKERSHQPSAALLKATLINSTRWLTGSDSIADHTKMPNFHQGFGCIYMPFAIPNQGLPNSNLRLEFLDTWNDPNMQFNRTGQRVRFKVSISGGSWLRICLVWTDLPARALQNNLNLFVENIQSGQKWMGNEDLPMSLHIPDPNNNVEVVRLENPASGDYLIQVQASNLLQPRQDFALVVTGDLTSPLEPFPHD